MKGSKKVKVELLGFIDYNKLCNELKERNVSNVDEIIEKVKKLEQEERIHKVSAAGHLSRFAGDVFEILGITNEKTMNQNIQYIKRVINMGHDSITDHDYLVFALKDVTPIIEQTVIEERFSSFTIKSRREVDFSRVGFYTPDFRNDKGIVLLDNDKIKNIYNAHMRSLFNDYSKLVSLNVNKEDARFVLPYSYYSNIIMGVDAHTLKDMIIKYTNGELSRISEIKQFGLELKRIAQNNIPYICDLIDKDNTKPYDVIDDYLGLKPNLLYKILEKPDLLYSSLNIDENIIRAALMRRYQYSYEYTSYFMDTLSDKQKREIMKLLMFDTDGLELKQINFEFQIPISFAVLTHLTRHRTHPIMVPSFTSVDIRKYKVPPIIEKKYLDEYNKIYENNIKMYNHFKNDYGICSEDLVYFILSGNMVNVVTNLDGKTLAHILRLRECNKAQWEIRNIATSIHNEISKIDGAKIFSSLLGPTCMTQGICNEGKESCGKVKTLKK